METIERILFILIQLTWGLPQNLCGAAVFLYYRNCPHFRYRHDLMTYWDRCDGLSLGMFAFVPQDAPPRLMAHEYGHSVQSLLLGPLYLPVIGLPSFLWCNARPFSRIWKEGRKRYGDFYPERWADHIADKVTRI